MTKQYTKSIKNISGEGYDMDNKQEGLGESFDEPNLSEENNVLIDKLLREVESTGFREKCLQIVAEKEKQKEKKPIHIGRARLSRVACLIIAIIIITSLGGVAYAAVLNHIKSIEVKDLDTHSEIEVIYNNDVDTVIMSHISDYKCPAWVPEDYYVDSEFKTDGSYNIIYKSKEENYRLHYSQDLSSLNAHYSTEDGIKEKIMFGKYTGEFIETEEGNYLIVTDGTYLYSLIGNVDYEAMKKIISSIRDFE